MRLLLPFLLLLGAAPPARALWVTAYYTGWRQTRLKPADIDFSAITHLAHFGVVPRADGSLDSAINRLTPASVKETVAAAHAAGRKVLFTVGGQGSRERFASAIAAPRRAAFVKNLVAFLREGGYDGVDVDMEELRAEDARDYARFIRELRTALDAVSPRPLLTAAALWQPALFARLEDRFDQINLMTYNLSGPYSGWVAWHSGALYSGGAVFPGKKTPLPSADGLVEAFVAAGVPRAKLGIGMSFNAYVWSGEVSAPGQAWTEPPSIKILPYYSLAAAYALGPDGAGPATRWDAGAQAAYLSVAGSNPAEARFVSYENETSAAARVRYARGKGLGGLIVWDIAAGRRDDVAAPSRDALLQAMLRAKTAATGSKGGAR